MENKTGKYLKYAIGEIALVVIGILIALQINNWNETQKQNREEISILKNLHENLKQAKLQSTSFIENEEKLRESLIMVLGINANKEQEHMVSITDSTFKDLMWSFESQIPVINTYSDIKSTGKLSVIKNREIRESFNGLELAINELNNLVSDRLKVQQLRIDEIAVNEINFIPLLKKRQPDIDIANEIPNNYKSVLSNPKTRNLLGMKLELTDDVSRKRKDLSAEIDTLISLLETELKK
jgi:hypothetical protein